VKKLLFLSFIALLFSAPVFAHEPFTLVSSEKKTIKAGELAELEKTRSEGIKSGTNLTFVEKNIRLLVTTGPEDDMLSYRIQGMRNPTLIVPADASIRIFFVNTDSDMRHDVRFAHVVGEFEIAPALEETAGSNRLTARGEGGVLQAEEVVIKANSVGQYKYFCSVRGHAKGGMWGNIAVGVMPDSNVKPPEKMEHVHSPDEDHDAKPAATPTPSHQEHAMPKPEATPAPAHQDHGTPKPAASPTPEHQDHGAMGGQSQDGGHQMSSSIDIGDPMNREGSGTSWLPDSSPMHAFSKMYKDGGMLMLMGTGFLRYTQVGSDRDVSVAGKGRRSRVSAPTMFMAMYSRPLTERSQLGLRVMASLDPIIERGYGYPLLYQSGELYRGLPIHDRQHPHDFISELAASYSYKVTGKQSFFLYGGIVGEPALGPPMFLHRPSGMNNPDAPIGHHWQDASHITWGVLTAGYNFGKFKIEGSAFNGTEPDENRWAFDTLRLNSFSGRFSFNPTKDLSFQISHGYLKRPERAEPDLDHIQRTTASAIYNRVFDEDRNWASAFIWGQNNKEGEYTNSVLFESDYTFGKNSIFGRVEKVEKDGHELVISHEDPLSEGVYWVGSYSLGYVRDIVKDRGLDVGIGGKATWNTNPAALTPIYGGTNHGGWQLFVRFRPSKMKH
jgi:plastocyanin